MRHYLCVASVVLALAGCNDDSTSEPKETEQAAASPVTLSTDPTGLVATPAAVGRGTSIRLDDHFHSAVMARRNDDGSVSIECFDEQDAADQFAQGIRRAQPELEVQ